MFVFHINTKINIPLISHTNVTAIGFIVRQENIIDFQK